MRSDQFAIASVDSSIGMSRKEWAKATKEIDKGARRFFARRGIYSGDFFKNRQLTAADRERIRLSREADQSQPDRSY